MTWKKFPKPLFSGVSKVERRLTHTNILGYAYGSEDVFPTLIIEKHYERPIENEGRVDYQYEEEIVVIYLDFDKNEMTELESFSDLDEALAWLKENGFEAIQILP